MCRVTHWVSSRSKGDGLHVMIGNYLRRNREKRGGEENREESVEQRRGEERRGGQKESMWVT